MSYPYSFGLQDLSGWRRMGFPICRALTAFQPLQTLGILRNIPGPGQSCTGKAETSGKVLTLSTPFFLFRHCVQERP